MREKRRGRRRNKNRDATTDAIVKLPRVFSSTIVQKLGPVDPAVLDQGLSIRAPGTRGVQGEDSNTSLACISNASPNKSPKNIHAWARPPISAPPGRRRPWPVPLSHPLFSSQNSPCWTLDWRLWIAVRWTEQSRAEQSRPGFPGGQGRTATVHASSNRGLTRRGSGAVSECAIARSP